MLFSILVPSLYTRFSTSLPALLKKLMAQAARYEDVEVLCFLDNKKRSGGFKRGDLMRLAQGTFLAMVDDDDDVSDDYVESIVTALGFSPALDVLVFDHECWLNGEGPFLVHPGIEYPNEQCNKVDGKWADVKRKPLHTSVWCTSIALKGTFPDISYGEDWAWAQQCLPFVKRQVRLEKTLYIYRYNTTVTECEERKA